MRPGKHAAFLVGQDLLVDGSNLALFIHAGVARTTERVGRVKARDNERAERRSEPLTRVRLWRPGNGSVRVRCQSRP